MAYTYKYILLNLIYFAMLSFIIPAKSCLTIKVSINDNMDNGSIFQSHLLRNPLVPFHQFKTTNLKWSYGVRTGFLHYYYQFRIYS